MSSMSLVGGTSQNKPPNHQSPIGSRNKSESPRMLRNSKRFLTSMVTDPQYLPSLHCFIIMNYLGTYFKGGLCFYELVWNPRQSGVHSWYFTKQCSALSESLLNQSPNSMFTEHCADAQISSEVEVLTHHNCWRSYRIYHMSKMHTRGRPHSAKTQQWIWPHENKRESYS